MQRSGPVFIGIFILALGACTQVAWKSGAGSDDLKRDETACRAAAGDDDGIRQCLRAKGWSIGEFQAPAAAEEGVAAPLTAAPAAPASSGGAAPIPAPVPLEAKAAAPDPGARVSVQTWWKAGAQAADFNIDAGVCVDALGSDSAPDYERHLYSRALVGCLEQRGWHAGRDPVYTPLR